MQHQWQYCVAIALAERAEELSTLPLHRLTGNWEEERATVLLTLVFQKAIVYERERVGIFVIVHIITICLLVHVPPPALCVHVMATPTGEGTTRKICFGTQKVHFCKMNHKTPFNSQHNSYSTKLNRGFDIKKI